MVSKPKSKKPFPSAKLKTALGSLGKVAQTAVTSHPAALGLVVMVVCKAANIANTMYPGEHGPKSADVSRQLEGLYAGAQAIALAAAIVPAVVAVAGAAGQIGAGALTPKPTPTQAASQG